MLTSIFYPSNLSAAIDTTCVVVNERTDLDFSDSRIELTVG